MAFGLLATEHGSVIAYAWDIRILQLSAFAVEMLVLVFPLLGPVIVTDPFVALLPWSG